MGNCNTSTQPAQGALLTSKTQITPPQPTLPISTPKEIKSLRAGDILFEIRWAGIPVHECPPTGPERHTTAEVRLIHAQPYDELGLCVLGLHAHEKAIIDGDAQATKRLQDDQIDLAEQRFSSGRSTCWGVQRRSQHGSELPTRTPSS